MQNPKRLLFLVFIPFTILAISAQAQPNGAAIYQKHCAACHDGNAVTRAPNRNALQQMTPEVILQALENGTMKQQGAALTAAERKTIAEFLSGKSFGKSSAAPIGFCNTKQNNFAASTTTPQWNGWSNDVTNTRFQSAKMAGLTATQVPKLKLKWAFGYTGTAVAYSQPTIVGNRIFVGSASRNVYSLDAQTGCIIWQFQPDAPVRAAMSIGKIGARSVAYFGDQRAFAYAVDAATGELIWKTRVDDQSVARVTGAPTLHNGKLYVPVSMPEDGLATNPKYECCKLRSNVVALDAATGKQIWKTYTVTEEPKPTTKNKIGTQQWGPSGASVWAAPTIDTKLNVLYIGTGDNHSHPTTDTSDAILALNLDTGKIVWSQQFTKNDAFNVACVRADQTNCPQPVGPDSDFGSPLILTRLPNGRRVLLAGQKSAVVHALDPDANGKILWQTRIGKGGLLGGIQWGMAADAKNVYAALSDIAFSPGSTTGGSITPLPDAGGGLFALDIATGKKVWNAPAIPCGDHKNCSPAQSAAISAIPGVVFSGSIDGHLRAYATKDGKVIWDYDTAHDYETTNGVKAKGGSLDASGPVIVGGMLYLNSGYGYWGGMPGNVLLAFSIEGK